MEGYRPNTSSPEASKQRVESLRNRLFQQLVAYRVLNQFHKEMDEADFSEESIQEINDTFASLSEENKRAVLAIPAQLRPGLFKKYAEVMAEGKMKGSEIVFDLLSKARNHGFTLGFHLSPNEIKPDKDGNWVIKGTEIDHRHNDLPMAYYSMDYEHRYLKKPVQWLYVVRAETKESSGHYRDNDGAWGHALSLSIVDAIDLAALENEMETRIKSLEGKKEEGDAVGISPQSQDTSFR